MSEVKISTAFLFTYRQSAGETPAIRWSRLDFRIACIFRIANISPGVSSGSQAERLHPRIAGISPACGCTQPLMSEVKISSAFLFAYRQSAGETPAIRWSRLLSRIAGVLPACGCTQPLMSEVKISTAFLFALRQIACGTPAILLTIFFNKKIVI
ncbi:MAG: hypothetical protein LBP59_01055 [Planctomycetaceae bacterium]|jgi:hypothetical protein|nr:hypothetical protein [Planctomycetaceae bacterium]